eukprot:547861_1
MAAKKTTNRSESPDLIILQQNVCKASKGTNILDLCSSSDDEQSNDEFHNYNVNVSGLQRKRTRNVSNKQYLPSHKRRKLNINNHNIQSDNQNDQKNTNNTHKTDDINKIENDCEQKTDTTKHNVSENKFKISQSEIRLRRTGGNPSSYVSCFTECIRHKQGIYGNIAGRSTNDEYHVSIHKDKCGYMHGKCTCPCQKKISDDKWCKHIAALGITYIKEPNAFSYQSIVL